MVVSLSFGCNPWQYNPIGEFLLHVCSVGAISMLPGECIFLKIVLSYPITLPLVLAFFHSLKLFSINLFHTLKIDIRGKKS